MSIGNGSKTLIWSGVGEGRRRRNGMEWAATRFDSMRCDAMESKRRWGPAPMRYCITSSHCSWDREWDPISIQAEWSYTIFVAPFPAWHHARNYYRPRSDNPTTNERDETSCYLDFRRDISVADASMDSKFSWSDTPHTDRPPMIHNNHRVRSRSSPWTTSPSTSITQKWTTYCNQSIATIIPHHIPFSKYKLRITDMYITTKYNITNERTCTATRHFI